MKAALVTSFDAPPRYADVPDPVGSGPDEVVVEVLAAALHPRVRSTADGSHYTSDGELPIVPGIDGVGRTPDGVLRYFVLPDTALGSMAERTVIDIRRSVALPDGADPISIAAAMNPAMSSWVALRRRITFSRGDDVLVLGATGNAGSMAVRVAKLLGAGRIVAVGRDRERLEATMVNGASDIVAITADPQQWARELGDVAGDVDVVIDYLWGDATVDAMTALVRARHHRGVPMTWIEIGSVAGAVAPLPSAAFRAARLQLVGSGQGSVATEEIVAELAGLAEVVMRGDLVCPTHAMPLSEVEQVWRSNQTGVRTVFVPNSDE